jgi:photosystem II stability/assembly factor-like uncharacterized protein
LVALRNLSTLCSPAVRDPRGAKSATGLSAGPLGRNCHLIKGGFLRKIIPLEIIIISLLLIPNNLFAQWEKLQIPFGASVSAIALNSSSIFIYLNHKELLLRSKDKGESWQKISKGFSGTISSMVSTDTTIYVSTSGSGIFRYSIKEDRWQEINTGLPYADIIDRDIGSIYFQSDTLYACLRYDGIYRSTNNGDSWQSINNGLRHTCVNTMSLNAPYFLAGTWEKGVFRSTNNGATWDTTGLCDHTISSIVSQGSNAFVGSYEYGIFRSTDNGLSWTAKNHGLSNLKVSSLLMMDSIIFAGTSRGLFLSKNNGYSWEPADRGVINNEIHSLVRQGSSLYATTVRGIYRSCDKGNTWHPMNNGLTYTYFDMIVAHRNILFIETLFHGIFRSKDDGRTWQEANNGLNANELETIATNGKTIFVGTNKNGIYRSTNDGTEWQVVNNGIIPAYIESNIRKKQFVDNDDTVYHPVSSFAFRDSTVYAGLKGGGIYYSNDNGNSWHILDTSISGSWILTLKIKGKSFFVSFGNGGVFKTDNMKNWYHLTKELNVNFVKYMAIAGSTILIRVDEIEKVKEGSYCSINMGTNWYRLEEGLPDPLVGSFFVDNDIIFIKTKKGPYFSVNGGITWEAMIDGPIKGINPQEEYSDVYPIMVHNDYLYALGSNCIWKSSISQIVRK